MPRTDEVSDLVRQGVICGSACVMDDGERIVGVGMHSGRQPTTLGIIHDQERDVGSIQVAQSMDLVHVAVAPVGEPPDMVDMLAFLHVVRPIGVHHPKLDMADVAEAKGLVRLVNGEIDQLAPDIGVFARRFLRVSERTSMTMLSRLEASSLRRLVAAPAPIGAAKAICLSCPCPRAGP